MSYIYFKEFFIIKIIDILFFLSFLYHRIINFVYQICDIFIIT